MASNIKWNDFMAGPRDAGFNKPGMEIFDKKEVSSLIREVLQNSTDNPGKGQNQILVEFKVVKKSFPDAKTYIDILAKCQKFCEGYGQTENDRSIKFYEEAQSLLQKPNEIDFLVISDYNTTGLNGKDKDRKKGWYRMVESLGVTLGGTSTNSGSKGIGKNAPFNLSKLGAVFYSTISEEDGYAFKGLAQLNAFDKSDGTTTSGDYTFCYENNTSVRDISDIPDQFKRNREEFGTDIFVAGFALADSNWQKLFIIETIRNYYAAIWNDKLIVKIGDIEINKSTLLALANENLTPKDDTRYFIECLQVDPVTTTIDRLGLCSLYIKLDDRFKKRVDYMRNKKMKIFDKQRPYIIENYAAVFICEADEGSILLRTMEGAEHTFWDPKKDLNGENILENIENWIREELLKHSKITNDDESIVASTENLLPMVDTGSGNNIAKTPDGKVINKETAQEVLITPETEITEIPILSSNDTRIKGVKGIPVVKIKRNKKEDENKRKKGKAKKKGQKKNPKKLMPSEDFQLRLIKDDSNVCSYNLIIKSLLSKEVVMNINMIPVGEYGEQEKLGFISSAKYSDGKDITVIPGSGQLCKVKIQAGANTYKLTTINNRKLSFNIIGNEI